MPISGLVITLDSDESAAQRVSDDIRARSSFELGERQSHRLPAVLETPDRAADKREWEWLNALPGVMHVDVVFIHFDQPDSDSTLRSSRSASELPLET